MKGLFKGFLVFGLLKKLIVLLFKFIYFFIKFLNLQMACLVLLVGLVLVITGTIPSSSVATTIFYVMLVLSIFVSITSTIKNLLFPKERKDKKTRSSVQIVETDTESEETEGTETKPSVKDDENNPVNINSTTIDVQEEKIKYPIYFAVKQNANYIMAEYKDRYELLEKTPKGLVKIRTDYKR